MMRNHKIIARTLTPLLMLFAACTPTTAFAQKGLAYFQGEGYQPRPLLGSGYGDASIAEGRWRIIGYYRFDTGQTGVAIAVYRGALLAKANGFPYFMIVNGRITNSSGKYATRVWDQRADMTMVGLPTADTPAKCEAKGEFVRNCRVLEVDETIATYGSLLHRSPAQREADLDAVRNLPFHK